MGVWYPSVVVNLELRFDEAFNVNEDQSPDGTSMASLATGGPAVFGPPQVRPLVLEGQRDKLSQVGGRQPRSGTVELNGLRQAHTFEFRFDFRDLPVDPRIIRDSRIEIFLGVIQPQSFARGVTRANQDGTRDSVLSTELSSTNKTRLLFVGMIDEGDTEHTDKGSFVNIKGRDLRGMLLDTKVDPRVYTSLDLSKDIVNVTLQILAKSPFGGKINVYTQPQEWPNGIIPSPATADGVTRVRLGADGTRNPMSSPQGEGDKIGFWDLITKYCGLVGAVPFFVGKDLWVRPINGLYEQLSADGTRPTPFVNGQARTIKNQSTTEKIKVRRFVFGRDLLNIKFSRKFRGQKTPVVEIVSIDTSSKQRGLQKMVIARWPDNTGALPVRNKYVTKAEKTSVAPSGQKAQTEVLRFSIPGIKSKKVLTDMAKNLYQEIGRNELGGSFSTRDFASFNTDNDQDPDLLFLQPADAVQFVTDKRALESRKPAVSELQRQAQLSFGAAVDELTQTLGDATLARVLVATARNSIVELQDTFRVKNVKYTFNEGGAVAIDGDFENYIEVRSGAVNPAVNQNTATPVGKSTP